MCLFCRHWRQVEHERGECHRYPPTMIYGSGDAHGLRRWVHVLADDYCGEWEGS